MKTINKYTKVLLDWFLRRRNADSHNFEKVLMDALEKGGLFGNDKYIMNCTRSVQFDPKNPRVIIEI